MHNPITHARLLSESLPERFPAEPGPSVGHALSQSQDQPLAQDRAPLAATPVAGARSLLPFEAVRERVRHDDAGKWDELVLRRDLTLRNGLLTWPCGEQTHRLTLSPLAETHLATRLGIPAHYYRALPPSLKDHNANHWLQAGKNRGSEGRGDSDQQRQNELRESEKRQSEKRQNERWRLRCQFGTTRAILSDAYSPLDNGPLCEVIAQMLAPTHSVNWFGLDDESFYLQIVDRHHARVLLPGDDYFCGVYIGNSEVGARSVQVEAYLMRLVCSNGLVAVLDGQSLLRRRHIHIQPDRFQSALREAFAQALQVADGFLEALRRTTTQVVPDPPTTLERLAERFGLSEATQRAALSALSREAPRVQETAYGVLQGLTEAAQLLPDTARHDLETLAGSLAQHGVPQWALRRDETPGHEETQQNERWTPHAQRSSRALAEVAR